VNNQKFKCDKCSHIIYRTLNEKFDIYPLNDGFGKGICEKCEEGTLRWVPNESTLDHTDGKVYDDKSYNKQKYWPQEYIESRKKLLNRPSQADFKNKV
jgi:hypothetical protein